jgi:hypothetical protein
MTLKELLTLEKVYKDDTNFEELGNKIAQVYNSVSPSRCPKVKRTEKVFHKATALKKASHSEVVYKVNDYPEEFIPVMKNIIKDFLK